MFNKDANLFFMPPHAEPNSSDGWFGVLYLLRRDIDICMGIDPNTGKSVTFCALWPGAMSILAGIDLMAKFFAGSDEIGEVKNRFIDFLTQFFDGMTETNREVIYQLRNALLHSFGLYSSDTKGKVYRFILSNAGTAPLVSHTPPDQYKVDLKVLHREFEKAVTAYCDALGRAIKLTENFDAMYGNYGRVHIG